MLYIVENVLFLKKIAFDSKGMQYFFICKI